MSRPRPRNFVLYRIYDRARALLYVGATTNPSLRLQAHGNTREWWNSAATITLTHFDDFETLAAAEVEAIETENPRYNLASPTAATPWSYKARRSYGTGGISQRSSDGMWVGTIEAPKGADGKRRQRRVYSKDRDEVVRKLALLKAELGLAAEG